MTRRLSAVVLAAGEGARMRSTRPKPLHLLCGRAMVLYVLDALPAPELDRAVVVVGHGAERVTKKLTEDSAGLGLEFVEQQYQRGTGDAVAVGLTGLPDDDDDDDERDVLVVPGDTPLLRPRTVAGLVAEHRQSGAACTILTARLDDPTGYGRIVRVGNDDKIARIVEQADAAPDELEIDEVNTGIFCFRRNLLAPALRLVHPDNAQGEYYLTDVVEVLADAGHRVVSVVASDPSETRGVNDRAQLAAAEAGLRERTNRAWLGRGVTMVDPAATYIDATVELAADVTIFPGAILQGRTHIGQGVEIGPGCRLIDCRIGEHSRLEHTVGNLSEVGADCQVGPYAVLEQGSRLAPGTRTGPFYTAATAAGLDD
ncbi:MAG: NTP transferase domain-containing protein [Acidimicrobiales bacterium]|nr:NTP transferase domain-containing protein [Acidimicrobiales bacterium]